MITAMDGMPGRARARSSFEVIKMMVCEICGREAEYNEKLNVYYCREHGFNTWIYEVEKHEHVLPEAVVSEEAVLG
jgi:hypothetical protein